MPGELKRCGIDDYALLSIMNLLTEAKEIRELDLHLYGNLLSKASLEVLIECVKEMKLKKFILSIFDFAHQENEQRYADLVAAFNQLDIEEKKLL